jgi:hypothetical protein
LKNMDLRTVLKKVNVRVLWAQYEFLFRVVVTLSHRATAE